MVSDAAYDLLCFKIPAGPTDGQGRHPAWAMHVRDHLATWPGVCVYEVYTKPDRVHLGAVVVLVKCVSR